LANGVDGIGAPVEQFDDGRNEKRHVGQDDAQQENVARLVAEIPTSDDGDGDGNVEGDSDETANEFYYH
jgi:hypothetical protein